MKLIPRYFKFGYLCFPIVLLLLSCSNQAKSKEKPTFSQDQLSPFHTTTATQTPDTEISIKSETPSSTPNPTLSPTPLIYNIAEGDTYTSIAYRYGVKVSDLIELNPGIDPNFLTIGITITIPITKNSAINQRIPTPIPVDITPPFCYRDEFDGLWCLATIDNPHGYDVENVSIVFELNSEEMEDGRKQRVYSPLYILPSGASMPMIAYFSPPIPLEYRTNIKLLSVLPKSEDEKRFLTPRIGNQTIQLSANGKSAMITGQISILEKEEASSVWIIAVAFSQEGQPVGFRKWESNSVLAEGERLFFSFPVYSLGPPINRVELLFEAHP